VTETDLTFLHVFPYSERPDTPAARMPPVPKATRRERATRLREAGLRNARRFYGSQVGREIAVLAETETSGHSEHFVPVQWSACATPGQIVRFQVRETTDTFLVAEPLLMASF
jgi:threonylcarbamoyladenosine tRNA methylthiotransferase MtaB